MILQKLQTVAKHRDAIEILERMHCDVLSVSGGAISHEAVRIELDGLASDVSQFIASKLVDGMLTSDWIEAIHCAFEDIIDD